MSRHRFKNDAVCFFPALPFGWREERLHNVVELRTSNVDKKSEDGEKPVRLCNYIDVYKNDKVTMSLDFMEATATEAQVERFSLQVGDVVITTDSEAPDDIGVPALISETAPDLICGYHLTILRPNPEEITGSYLLYSVASRLSAYQFYLAANGVTRFGLTYQGTKNLRIAFPPLREQQQIAEFLDWKTGEIDALIARKQELLEKLKEKRLAVITRAVTRGLNSEAPLRDSGIPWIGHVPEHWEVKTLRRFVDSIEQGWSPECENRVAAADEWGVVKAGCCNGGRFNPEDNKALPPDLEAPEHLEIKAGDLLMSRASGSEELIGSVALVPSGTRGKLLLSDKTYRLRYDGSVLPAFLGHTLQSPIARFQIQAIISGAIGLARNIAQSDVKNLAFAIPPITEQSGIVEFLDQETGKIEALTDRVTAAIARLAEYRTALITAATTGKIDVRCGEIPQTAA